MQEDEMLKRIIRRVEANGIAFIESCDINRILAKKKKYLVFNNRRLRKSVIIEPKKLKKLLGLP